MGWLMRVAVLVILSFQLVGSIASETKIDGITHPVTFGSINYPDGIRTLGQTNGYHENFNRVRRSKTKKNPDVKLVRWGDFNLLRTGRSDPSRNVRNSPRMAFYESYWDKKHLKARKNEDISQDNDSPDFEMQTFIIDT